MKTFEVLIKAYTFVVVQAEDEERATEIASDTVDSLSGWELESWEVEEEFKDQRRIERAIETSPWHKANNEPQPLK